MTNILTPDEKNRGNRHSADEATLMHRIPKLFFFSVVLPTILAIVYYGVLAADVFVSESTFVVRSPQHSAPSAGLVGQLLQGSGLAGSEQDTYAVNDYVLSRDALHEINANGAFEKAYGKSTGDFLSRFGMFGFYSSFEDLTRYFRKRVHADYDTTSAITTLSIEAFTAEDAQKFNSELLALGERRVNQMNDRAYQDMIGYAKQEIVKAEADVQDASSQLSMYREKQSIYDPERQSAIQLQSVAQLQTELIASRTQLAQLILVAPQNSQIPVLKAKISALSAELIQSSQGVVGGNQSLANKSGAYERLVLNRDFADKQLTSALASLEAARVESEHQQLYLERIAQPSLPDKALLPYRVRGVLSTAILGLVAWGTLSLLIASVREHRD